MATDTALDALKAIEHSLRHAGDLRRDQLKELADEIRDTTAALRSQLAEAEAERDRMREALQKIANGNPGNPKWLTDIDMAEIARSALEARTDARGTGMWCPDHPDTEFVVYCPVEGCNQPRR